MSYLDDELMGIGEIAEIAGVSKQAVTNWRARFNSFPNPVAELASGPIFLRSKIRSWLRKNKRNLPMAHILSVINFKGGVAKTSTSVALAEVFSAEMNKKVLVIDLDPQTNATLMLLGEKKWLELNREGFTLAQLFKDAMNSEEKKFNLRKTLQKNASDVREAGSVDILPSSLDLIDVQDRLAFAPPGKFHAQNPTEILHRAVKSKLDDYDIVIIDCPPNLGIVTLNGLRFSNYYIIPTIPDVLSTYGIPQILNRIEEFAKELGEEIVPLGIVITKYQEISTVHKTTLKDLKANVDLPKPYKTKVKLTNSASSAAEYNESGRTLRQKYGTELTNTYIALAKEIWSSLDDEI